MRENQTNLQRMLEIRDQAKQNKEYQHPNMKEPITQEFRFEDNYLNEGEMDYTRTDSKRTRDETILSADELNEKYNTPPQYVEINDKITPPHHVAPASRVNATQGK